MSDNDNLELKKRSRRRLVGAAALALIAAILLPMVMDDEPSAPIHDIQVTIPDRSLDTRPIPAREAIDGLQGTLPFDSSPDIPPPPVAGDAPPEAERAVRPPDLEPAPVEAPVAKKPPAPPPAAPSASSAEPDARTGGGDAESARARAILEGRDEARPASSADADSEFVVQVGAFSDMEKASDMQINLAARGFSTFFETADGVTRVRMGPYGSRAEAEAMVQKLKSASINGVVSTR